MGKPFLWCTKPKLELWPVLEQDDAQPSELRRTLTELRGALTELRRALNELRRTLNWGPRKNLIFTKIQVASITYF